ALSAARSPRLLARTAISVTINGKGDPHRGSPFHIISCAAADRRPLRWRGESAMLRLRPYKPMDAGRIVTWVEDRDTFSAWCANHMDWPLTEAVLQEFCGTF